jgi:TPR repeat protein
VQVVQTHTGIRLGPSTLDVADDSDATRTRCSGDAGAYAKELGYYCRRASESGDPPPADGSESSLFFDISVIMPDAARVVFHCSTLLDGRCEGLPEYPQGTSVVCSDFVFGGTAYKDCVASGSSPEGIGIYKAALHGNRMTIFGAKWKRRYIKYGTWQYLDPPAQEAAAIDAHKSDMGQDPPPAVPDPAPAVAQESKPEAPPPTKPALPPDPKPDETQDAKPSAPEAKPTPPPEAKPATTPDIQPAGNQPAAPGKDTARPADSPASSATAAAADQAIDPQVIEQAKAGDPIAQYKLGYDYFLGRGVPLDYVQAAIWWRKAADQGYPQAQNNLGVLYNAGKGVPQSYAEAYFWENLAAARASGSQQAQFAKNRDESGSKLWFITRNRIQQRAQKWAADHPVPARSQEPREARQ